MPYGRLIAAPTGAVGIVGARIARPYRSTLWEGLRESQVP